jgi:predicted nucleic acid-binding protein|tara:strand:+ start:346 stop:636 length:291 start_codon:yes stop_codon:yes gene_type:complete
VIGELLSGFDAGSQSAENRTDLDAFLTIPRVSTVPISSETAERYAHIYVYLRSQSKPSPANDLWIAASAMEQSAALLTSDTHFLQIPQIIVQHLSP